MRSFISVKPDLHIVIKIAQHACDRVLKRVIKRGLHISRKGRKHMVGNVDFKMYVYGLLSLSLEWLQVLIFHKKLFQSIF